MKTRYIRFTLDDFERLLLNVSPYHYPALKIFDENDDFCFYVTDDDLLSKVEALHQKEMNGENQNNVVAEFLSIILYSLWGNPSAQMSTCGPQNIEKFEPASHSFFVKYEEDDD